MKPTTNCSISFGSLLPRSRAWHITTFPRAFTRSRTEFHSTISKPPVIYDFSITGGMRRRFHSYGASFYDAPYNFGYTNTLLLIFACRSYEPIGSTQ